MDRYADMEFAPPLREENLVIWMPSTEWVVERDEDPMPIYADSDPSDAYEWLVYRWVGGPDPVEVFEYYATEAEALAVAENLNTVKPPRPAMIHHDMAY